MKEEDEEEEGQRRISMIFGFSTPLSVGLLFFSYSSRVSPSLFLFVDFGDFFLLASLFGPVV